MNNHQPWKTNDQESRFNIRNGLKTQWIILWAVIAGLFMCGLGFYFGLVAGRQLFGG